MIFSSLFFNKQKKNNFFETYKKNERIRPQYSNGKKCKK